MSSPEFKAIVLDLFDTIVRWDPNDLPLWQWRGREMRSTMPRLLPMLDSAMGGRLNLDLFIDTQVAVMKEINEERESQGVEVTCMDRFVRILRRLNLPGTVDLHSLADELRRTHMAGVRSVTGAPKQRLEAVRTIANNYRLGLLSNFDDAETGRAILTDTGVAHLFDAVIISAEVGLRKPNPAIYAMMSEMLGLAPGEILFVGDTPRDDIMGPHQAGMSTVWINARARDFPEGFPLPKFVIEDLADLPRILGC